MRPRKKKYTNERIEQCKNILIENPSEISDKWSEIFGNSRPIHIEIGCGKGGFICEMAQKNPHVNFVAVERESDIIVMALEKAAAAGITNLRFILCDANELDRAFPMHEVSKIYLNFSDPWRKKRHYKRRLTYRDFLEIYKKILIPGGTIQFKTDNKPLFEFSLNEFSDFGFRLHNIDFDLHREYNTDIVSEDEKDNVKIKIPKYVSENVITEYENNFISQNLPIYYVEAISQ